MVGVILMTIVEKDKKDTSFELTRLYVNMIRDSFH